MFRKVLILLPIGIALLVGSKLYLAKNQKRSANTETKQTITTPIAITTTPTPTPPKTWGTFNKAIAKIKDGSLDYNTKFGDVDAYVLNSVDITNEFSYLTKPVILNIYVYKYFSGAKFDGGYEGAEWVIDLDEWRKWLMSLKVGKNTGVGTCSSWGCSNNDPEGGAIAKVIGKNKYFISDSYFPPSRSWIRNYTTFDSAHGLLIDINVISDLSTKEREIHKAMTEIEKLLP